MCLSGVTTTALALVMLCADAVGLLTKLIDSSWSELQVEASADLRLVCHVPCLGLSFSLMGFLGHIYFWAHA